jgi:2-hydroxychromene-2-carboxylate isomerase
MAKLEFYFDFLSPYTYLASTQVDALAARTGADVTYTPFKILELMAKVGNRPTTIECANKSRYAGADLGRWAARYQVPFGFNPKLRQFDVDLLRRGALAAADEGRAGPYVHAVLHAIWGEPKDLTDKAVLTAVVDSAGLDGAALLEAAREPRYGEALDHLTDAAAERGAFGSPTFFVGAHMFFGNDRFEFIEQSLAAA